MPTNNDADDGANILVELLPALVEAIEKVSAESNTVIALLSDVDTVTALCRDTQLIDMVDRSVRPGLLLGSRLADKIRELRDIARLIDQTCDPAQVYL